jgi:hypothetical protein
VIYASSQEYIQTARPKKCIGKKVKLTPIKITKNEFGLIFRDISVHSFFNPIKSRKYSNTAPIDKHSEDADYVVSCTMSKPELARNYSGYTAYCKIKKINPKEIALLYSL